MITDPLFVPARRTAITGAELATEIHRIDPSLGWSSVIVLVSQWSIETADGAACWNFNIGNKKRRKGRPFTMLRGTWEILPTAPALADGVREIKPHASGFRCVFDPPHPQTHFMALATLADGVADYLEGMRRRFAGAWPSVLAGDPEGFASGLKRLRYYTAPEADYRRALRTAFNRFDRSLPVAFLPALGFSSVTEYQRSRSDLVADGIAGPLTRTAIREDFGRKVARGNH